MRSIEMMSGDITIAVLAGGRSSRMGRDKAMLRIGEETMLRRIVGALSECGMPVMVVGRERPEEWDLDDVRFVPDLIQGIGPLGGIVSALRAAKGDVIAVACDMPLVDPAVIDFIVAAGNEPDDRASSDADAHHPLSRDDADGIAITLDGRLEPLCSLYRADALAMLESRIDRGELSLRGAIDAGRFRRVELPAGLAGRLRNLNTPDDLDDHLESGLAE